MSPNRAWAKYWVDLSENLGKSVSVRIGIGKIKQKVSVYYFFGMKNRYRYIIQFSKVVSVSVRLKSSKSVRIGSRWISLSLNIEHTDAEQWPFEAVTCAVRVLWSPLVVKSWVCWDFCSQKLDQRKIPVVSVWITPKVRFFLETWSPVACVRLWQDLQALKHLSLCRYNHYFLQMRERA